MRKLAASLTALGWLMAGACSETSPTAVALITSVRYERLSQTSGTPPSQVMIEISIPSCGFRKF